MLRHMFEWDVIKLDSFFRKLLVLWQAFDISFFRSSRLVKALLLSSAGKLLVIPVVIWGETHIYTTLLLTRLFMAVASTQAITGRCMFVCSRQSYRFGAHEPPSPTQMNGRKKKKKKEKKRERGKATRWKYDCVLFFTLIPLDRPCSFLI